MYLYFTIFVFLFGCLFIFVVVVFVVVVFIVLFLSLLTVILFSVSYTEFQLVSRGRRTYTFVLIFFVIFLTSSQVRYTQVSFPQLSFCMKLLPHGPVIRLAAREVRETGKTGKVIPSLYSRSDWNSGRDLKEEERRSGILLRLQDLRNEQRSGRRPVAVLKAQNSDFQVNEVGASGDGAFLQKCPKGRWRKISPQRTIMVETTPQSSSLSGADRSFAPRVQSYGEYVRRLGRVPPEKPILEFVMYREGIGIPAVLHRLQYELGVQREAIHWCTPPGGYLGSVCQRGFAVGVSSEMLPHASKHYNLNPLLFDPRGYLSIDEFHSSIQHRPQGYFFRVLLRCVETDKGETAPLLDVLRSVASEGFVNYFGIDHFGVGGSTLFDIAGFRGMDRTDRALGGYLQLLAESDPFHFDFFMAYLNADNSTAAGMAKLWYEKCKEARVSKSITQLIYNVYQYTEGCMRDVSLDSQSTLNKNCNSVPHSHMQLEQVWKECMSHLSSHFDDSGSEFIWNAMASQRLINNGLRVVKGDIVLLEGDNGTPVSVRVVQSDEEAEKHTIADVVLPVPYLGTVDSELVFPENRLLNKASYEQFAAQHHLNHILYPQKGVQRHVNGKTYRKIVERPKHLQASLIHDPSSLAALKTDLFLKQERKPVESLDLSYSLRVREPAVYNVSEKFVARMSEIRKSNVGEKSMVLSFFLPYGSSPYTFLREVFELRFARFHDLYGL